MAIFKCKMCGGNLEVTEGMTICECEYCGTNQTVPNGDDEKKTNLFNRANRQRIACEFDRAAGVYETIVAEFPQEAEGYWGLCLCEYGIEYVDDPRTAKKIPTCHRTSTVSIFESSSYKLALAYADPVAKTVYQAEAKAIDAIQKGILEIANKEDPFDIFICYKETDESGRRTPDSVLAQDLYDELTERGYKVFFSRITLEDKLGQEYEPYIFAALSSARVMLAIGTKSEYYDAVWVKNEWSRYLSLMQKDRKKTLIPCYRDMDAYDMPAEFKNLQGQDMGRLGFVQDLVRGIDKLIGKVGSVSARNMDSDSNKHYFEMAQSAYDGRNFKDAEAYCNKVLETDTSNYEAWFLKGKIIGWRSMDRQKESVNCFSKALELVPVDKETDLKKDTVEEFNKLSVAIMGAVLNNFEKKPDSSNAVLQKLEEVQNLYSPVLEVCQADFNDFKRNVAILMSDKAMNAWKNTIAKDYQLSNIPSVSEWETFGKRTKSVVLILEAAILLCEDDDEKDVVRYINLIGIIIHFIFSYGYREISENNIKFTTLDPKATQNQIEKISQYYDNIEKLSAEKLDDIKKKAVSTMQNLIHLALTPCWKNFSKNPCEKTRSIALKLLKYHQENYRLLIEKSDSTIAEVFSTVADDMNIAVVQAFKIILSNYREIKHPENEEWNAYYNQTMGCINTLITANELSDYNAEQYIRRINNIIMLYQNIEKTTYCVRNSQGNYIRCGKLSRVKKKEFDDKIMQYREDISRREQEEQRRQAEERKRQAEQAQRKQEIRNQKYWTEHAEEKQRLEAELNLLNTQFQELHTQIDPYDREISNFKSKREEEVPAEKEKSTVLEEISRLQQEKKALGIFKGKEKKVLQAQIDELNSKLPSFNESIEVQRKEQTKACNDKIREIEKNIKPIKDKIVTIEKRMGEIKIELTKDR